MSQEAVPEQEAAREQSAPEQGPPKGLLQQMDELMAALNADLTQLDADLQQSGPAAGTAPHTTPPAPRPPAGDEPTRF
ncbi:hypothetical protein AB0Q95_16950 [Streptomyces sp. NPDC059900]|uniref:hypothetical protein n=1 Tax=Streptomyces sp. NPDC059900 TaxID=3155816 RepID=UPI00343D5D07